MMVLPDFHLNAYNAKTVLMEEFVEFFILM